MGRGVGGERETEGNGLMSRRVFGVMNAVGEGPCGGGGFSGETSLDTSVPGRLNNMERSVSTDSLQAV